MATEVKNALKNPKLAVQIAVGDPFPRLIPQRRGTGIVKDGVYYKQPKRYVLKKAHLAMDDLRLFDTDGELILNSHHPGKNPLDALDPMGMANTEAAFNVAGGEWSSICDVTAHSGGISSFKVRPRTRTMHGRQRVKTVNDEVVMNVGKISRIKTGSLRHSFEVCAGDDKDERVYTVVGDLMGRSFSYYNEKEELCAVMARTKKALIKNAVLGSGSENTIDIAPGVDCSAILAATFGVLQCGASVITDAAKNFLVSPAKNVAVDSAMDQVTGDGDEGLASAVEGGVEGLEGVAEAGGAAVAGIGDFVMQMFVG